VSDLKELETKLTEAEAGKYELPLTKALNTHLADIAKEIPQLGMAVNALPEGLDFLKDIPVIDIAASGVAAELQSRDDIDKGWSADHARAADYGAAGIGLVGGGAAGAGFAAIGVAPVGAALIGGAAVVGIGDLAYQGFHEHWAEDIHQDGVAGGVLTGIEHMGENTGTDIKDMFVGVGHAGITLWHSMFG